MKYCFATLAIGEPYEKLTSEFYTELKKRTKKCDFFITTNNLNFPDLGERIIVNREPLEKLHDSRGGFSFNLNYKCLSLKHILKHEKNNPDYIKNDYVIFIDGDWIVHDGFCEEKILNMLDHMEKEKIDFLFERPASIGDGRKNPEQSFYMDKIYDYDILQYDKWDTAHVVNEQFLVFKNNYKFSFFTKRWEQFLWYTIHNDIRNYPDGFEIGVSALEAGMEWRYMGVFNHFLTSCFAFYTKLGDLHIRF
jgi:hypothetical protein